MTRAGIYFVCLIAAAFGEAEATEAASAATPSCPELAVALASGERVCRTPGDGVPFRDCDECPEMVVVPAGAFAMGSTESEDEQPIREVRIAAPFAVGRFELTRGEFFACVEAGGCAPASSDWDGEGDPRAPAARVSWTEVSAYVAWLSQRTGRTYRLLSEAEWEYAARAGTETPFYWGDEIGENNANCRACGSAWDLSSAAPVGSFAPNAFGLHDMLGNVWEWAADCSNEGYRGAPVDGSPWLDGNCDWRILRGGSYYAHPTLLTASTRNHWMVGSGHALYGARVAREIGQADPQDAAEEGEAAMTEETPDLAPDSPLDLAQKHLAEWLAHPNEFGEPPVAMSDVHRVTALWPGFQQEIEVALIHYEMADGAVGVGVSSPTHPGISFSFIADRKPGRDWTTLPKEDLLTFYAGVRLVVGWMSGGELEAIDPAPFDAMLVNNSFEERHTGAYRFFEETILCLRWRIDEAEMGSCGSLEQDDAVAHPTASAYHALPFEYYYFGQRWRRTLDVAF